MAKLATSGKGEGGNKEPLKGTNPAQGWGKGQSKRKKNWEGKKKQNQDTNESSSQEGKEKKLRSARQKPKKTVVTEGGDMPRCTKEKQTVKKRKRGIRNNNTL